VLGVEATPRCSNRVKSPWVIDGGVKPGMKKNCPSIVIGSHPSLHYQCRRTLMWQRQDSGEVLLGRKLSHLIAWARVAAVIPAHCSVRTIAPGITNFVAVCRFLSFSVCPMLLL
jgi:hypothetical protein